eukprot:766015-Hanusia_phi.AAC.2
MSAAYMKEFLNSISIPQHRIPTKFAMGVQEHEGVGEMRMRKEKFPTMASANSHWGSDQGGCDQGGSVEFLDPL